MKYLLLSILFPLLVGAVFFGSIVGYVYLVCSVSPWFLLLLAGFLCWFVGFVFVESL